MRLDCGRTSRIVFLLSLLHYLLVHEALFLKELIMSTYESFSWSPSQQYNIHKEGAIDMNTIFKFPKYQKAMLFIFLSAFFITGCPQRRPPETVDYVNVCRYTGLWYQIASYFNPNIGDLAGVTAEYSINQDCTVKVVNKGFVGGLDGTPVMIEGVARVVEPATNAKLAVSFPEAGIPGESEYWIIELGEYYSYAVVTNSERSSLFILNRRPTMDEATYEGIIDRLTKNGFDPEQIVKTVQIENAEMPPPGTVESVDLESYAGLWYEFARYDTIFDEDAEEVTAEYTLNDDGTVKVVNRGVRPDGNPTFIEGVARVLDPETNAKLGVTFDREELAGIEFDYWIIELDEDYEWAVVTNATRFVLYILSRTPALDETVYEDLLYRIVKKGFEADKVQLTPQP